MREVGKDVWQLSGKPRDGVNVYVIGDVLIDSGTALDAKRILEQIRGRSISAHALTHDHIDHYGSSAKLVKELGVPMLVGELDAPAVRIGKMAGSIPGLGERMLPAAKRCNVDTELKEGDDVAGFEVLFTPGHSPGHVSFWRESDRVLVCGDVMWGNNPFLLRGDIREPFPVVSVDPALNRKSARRLAALRPELVLFGHGPPLRDPDAFARAVDKLAG